MDKYAPQDVEHCQRKAAERILEDEAWRDGVDDRTATPLLEWALAQVQTCIDRVAARGGTASTLEDAGCAAADQARDILTVLAAGVRGELPDGRMREELARYLAAPLFASPADGCAAASSVVALVLAASGDTGARA